MTEYCVCVHTRSAHDDAVCFACYDERNPHIRDCWKKGIHKFKLDNLQLIEDLAKQKGLI